ncbi:MBL fold metallo-hydrolase [bacterium]|nr:MBL fold metallo-hydrolase [bacterium]
MKWILRGFVVVMALILVQCDKDSGTSPRQGEILSAPDIRISFIGHSSFLFTIGDSLRIVTDPYGASITAFYMKPDSLTADIVTVSHAHADHAQVRTVEGDPMVIREAGADTLGSVIIQGYLSEHGDWNGADMGANIIFVFQIGDVKIVHLGENRNVTEEDILSAINQADVLIAPTGQIASISFGELSALVGNCGIRTVIPSHFSPTAANRYYGSSTVQEYVNSLSPETVVVFSDELNVVPNMPEQVVVLSSEYMRTE